jgi:hypothetical protein
MLSRKQGNAMPDQFIEQVKEQITRYRSMLGPLESGKIRMGEARPGEPWIDRTQAQIEEIKRVITMLQSVVDRG